VSMFGGVWVQAVRVRVMSVMAVIDLNICQGNDFLRIMNEIPPL